MTAETSPLTRSDNIAGTFLTFSQDHVWMALANLAAQATCFAFTSAIRRQGERWIRKAIGRWPDIPSIAAAQGRPARLLSLKTLFETSKPLPCQC